MSGGTAEQYIAAVLDRIPSAFPERRRLEADLRLHLAELLADPVATESPEVRMGPAEEVARDFLAQLRLTPAPHARRFAAFLIDAAILAMLMLPLGLWARPWLEQLPLDQVIRVAALFSAALVFVYFVLPEALTGQSPGKRLTRLCVVREDGTRSGWVAAVLRRIPFVGNFFPIDAVFVFFTERHQRAFDKVAGTLVVTCTGD
jgi:uncharacterized RDD family membrane protein YckC